MRQTRRGLQFATAEGAVANVQVSLVSGFLFTGFALAWGANDFHLGLLGAIPFFAYLFQLWGAYLVDRKPECRRETTAFLGLIARCAWGLMALLPFIAGCHSWWIIPWIVAVYLIYHAFWNASGPGWVAWMAVLVPERIRGRYLGVRSWILESATIVTTILAGIFIDMARGAGQEREGFACMQALAVIAGAVCFLIMRRMPDPGHVSEGVELHIRYALQPLRNRSFRCLVGFVLCWQIGTNIALPFFSAHLIKNMQWSFRNIALLTAITSLAAIVTSSWWGRQADRHGASRIMELCGVGLLLVPLLYTACPWTWRWPIYTSAILNGTFMAGFNVALFSQTLSRLPERTRAMGSAVLNAISGQAGFLAGVLAGWLAETMSGWHWQLGPILIANYQVLFAISIFLRLPVLLLMRQRLGD